MKKIPLTQGKFATVDDADFAWLSAWQWQVVKVKGKIYAGRYENGKLILMHKEIVRHCRGLAERN